jgi:hypothetical protein
LLSTYNGITSPNYSKKVQALYTLLTPYRTFGTRVIGKKNLIAYESTKKGPLLKTPELAEYLPPFSLIS